jgi:hypothetical protein
MQYTHTAAVRHLALSRAARGADAHAPRRSAKPPSPIAVELAEERRKLLALKSQSQRKAKEVRRPRAAQEGHTPRHFATTLRL